MPTTRLSLRFTGLCGIVPKLAITQASNQATVLLVDAEAAPSGGGGGHVNPPHEPHVPVLICNAGSILAGGRGPDLTFNFQGQVLGVYYLNDQELNISGALPNSLSFIHSASAGNGCQGPSPDYQNFDWVVSLDTISPGAGGGQHGSGDVRQNCLNTPAVGVDPLVLARVRLTEGGMRTFTLAKDSSGGVLQWTFRILSGTPINRQQAVAEVVELSHDLGAATSVVFGNTLLRTTTYDHIRQIFLPGPQTIRLNSVDDGTGTGNRIVEAVVKNIPWVDLFGLRPSPPPNHRLIDTHFEHFYEMSNTPRDRRVPDPLLAQPRCPNFGGPGPANPQCPPALFNPNNSA